MGTISNTLGGYYQLANLLTSGPGTSTLSSGPSSSASSLQALETALLSSSGSGSSSGGLSAYTLDLSPAAQSLLSGGSTSSGNGTSTKFTLTHTQETQIENILAKYKDAPLDQATFDSIQNDLEAAGLSPQTLGAEDQVKSFNPTNVLLSALDGNYASIQTPAASSANEQTKESNYLQSIISLWKSEDTSGSSASGASSSTGLSA
jgi:hypothetical protein